MSNDSSKLDKMQEQLDNFFELSDSDSHNPRKVGTNIFIALISIFLSVMLLIYVISKFGPLLGALSVFSFTLDLFSNYGGYLLESNLGRIYLGFVTLLITIFMYFETIILLISIPFGVDITKNKNRYVKEISILTFLVAWIFLSGLAGVNIDPNLTQQTLDLSSTKVTFLEKWDNFMCFLSPQCYAQKIQQKEVKQSDQTEYRILFKTPNIINFKLKDIIDESKSTKLRLNYQVQAKGGDMFLKKLECYQGSKIDKQEPFDTINLNPEEIKNDELRALSGIICDLHKLKNIKDPGTIVITPVLYYSLKTRYEIKIPIVSLKTSTYESKKPYISKYKNIKPVFSNNIFKATVSSDPPFPFFYFTDSTENKQNPSEISINLNLANNAGSSLGTMIKSTIETAPTLPSVLTSKNHLEIPYDVSAFKNKANIEFLFEGEINREELEGKTEIEEFIIVDVKSEIKRKKDRVTITITDESDISTKLKEEEAKSTKVIKNVPIGNNNSQNQIKKPQTKGQTSTTTESIPQSPPVTQDNSIVDHGDVFGS